jgi:hypothetical protein
MQAVVVELVVLAALIRLALVVKAPLAVLEEQAIPATLLGVLSYMRRVVLVGHGWKAMEMAQMA